MAGQDDTSSLAESRRDDDEDEPTNHVLPDSHVIHDPVVNTEGHDVEMMDIAGQCNDNEPLLVIDDKRKKDAGEFQLQSFKGTFLNFLLF